MITVTIYGLDQYIVGRLSKDLTVSLAKVYEVDEDEINFIAPNAMYFHMGVEQTSWNVRVVINAPKKVTVLQDLSRKAILNTLRDLGVAINISIEYYYFSQDDYYEDFDKEYPRYIREDNVVDVEEEEEEEYREEGEGEDEIYTGNIFKDFSK